MSKITLPDLPYEYHALEPHISREIMTLHHTKHHQTYVNAYNAAQENLNRLVSDPSSARQQIALQAAIKFNGGGHINHSLFWKNLAPAGSTNLTPESRLYKEIRDTFVGGFEAFQPKFNEVALSIQGSGWAWLVVNTAKKGGRLDIITTSNQDPVLSPYVPLIGIDMWEHAFYLQYKNVKPDYLAAIWNVINWKEAEDRYEAAVSSFKL
ncbi:superoxide dismutase [Paucibacter sp. DJ4R-1]|nr:superoxide dismutase [Paucibacter sp. DJ4R-1]